MRRRPGRFCSLRFDERQLSAPHPRRFDDVASHWDELILKSHVVNGGTRKLYQEGALASLRNPLDLIALYEKDGGCFADRCHTATQFPHWPSPIEQEIIRSCRSRILNSTPRT
jgi:hypothetical protein